MPVFEFKARDADGGSQKGLVHGSSLDAVASSLAAKGWVVESLGLAQSDDLGMGGQAPVSPPPSVGQPPDSLREEGQTGAPVSGEVSQVAVSGPIGPETGARGRLEIDVIGPLVGTVPLTQLHMFFRQMHSMLHAGINPAQALETLSNQGIVPKFRAVLKETKEHVIAGRPISVGFQRYPEVFSPLVISMVRAGEEGGFLAEQCRMIANYLQQDIELRNLIRRETAYPKLILGAAFVIILSANAFILSVNPQAQRLPVPTVAIVTLIVGLIVGWFLVRLGKRQSSVMSVWDSIVHAIPFVGNTYHGFAMAKFGRAFGALNSAGLPLSQCAKLAADASGNEWVRGKIYPAIPRLDSGESVTDVFLQTGAFSPMVIDMLRAGEMTGNIEEMLVKVSELYEDEGTTKARQMALLLGILVFLGVAAFILLFIILPFYMGYGQSQTTV